MKILKKSQKSLDNWTNQDWGYSSGKSKGTGRYFPKSVWDLLSDNEKASTNKKKKTKKKGNNASYTKKEAKLVRNA